MDRRLILYNISSNQLGTLLVASSNFEVIITDEILFLKQIRTIELSKLTRFCYNFRGRSPNDQPALKSRFPFLQDRRRFSERFAEGHCSSWESKMKLYSILILLHPPSSLAVRSSACVFSHRVALSEASSSREMNNSLK